MVIKYKENLFTKEQGKTNFLVYRDDKETTYMCQIYKGKNKKELLQAFIELWEMIDKYEMFPTHATTSVLTPDRTRASNAAIIANILPVLPITNRARQIEIKKRKAHALTLRKIAFCVAKNMLATPQASTAIGNAMREEKRSWQAEEDARDPAVNPDPVEFHSARTMKRVLNSVTGKVLPDNCLTLQLDYLKTTKKPKSMNCKTWTSIITEMKNKMYFMTPENYVLSQAVINQEIIDKNLPLKWIIDWRKMSVYNGIAKSLGAGYLTMKEFLTALETLEESVQIKNQIEKMKVR